MVDWRNIKNGKIIPSVSYSDQPYIVQTGDGAGCAPGAWLCAITTGAGREGEPGQTVITTRSTDRGGKWSDPLMVEPPDGPEASYAVLLKLPSGRIAIFYNHNTDNIRQIRADPCEWIPDGICRRVDSLGYFVFKISDDHGRSWSAQRYPIPVREMAIDRQNPYGGSIRYFWNVGKPFIHDSAAYISLHKVGGIGDGFFTISEGVLLKSSNLLVESDPAKVTWETLPEGEYGLRTPPGGGPIAEEHSYVVLSDGSFYSIYRTIDGHPACATSRDGGRHWDVPQYQAYADGRLMKHPRAANFAWKCQNGKYLYWFHNHGGRFIREHPRRRVFAYEDRNPVWLCGGEEVDSPGGKTIRWSQPEIVLYDDDPYVRISYPDLVEDGGEVYLTETQKSTARVHRVDPLLLEGLWNQFVNRSVVQTGMIISLPKAGKRMPASCKMPRLPAFTARDGKRADYGTKDLRQGFSIDLWVRFDALDTGQVLLDNCLPSGKGICLQTTPRGTVEILLNDGRSENRWDCDPGILEINRLHHIAVVVDGGPKTISFIVDGRFNDGGESRQFGWGRFNPNLVEVNGGEKLHIAPSLKGEILSLRLYRRALRTSEVIGSYRAGAG